MFCVCMYVCIIIDPDIVNRQQILGDFDGAINLLKAALPIAR